MLLYLRPVPDTRALRFGSALTERDSKNTSASSLIAESIETLGYLEGLDVHKQDSFPFASEVEHLFKVLFRFGGIETNFSDAYNEERLASSFGDGLCSKLRYGCYYGYTIRTMRGSRYLLFSQLREDL